MIKRLLQYKTEHVRVILQENKYATRAVIRPKLSSGFLHKVSMSLSTLELPMTFYSAKTWVGISSYSFIIVSYAPRG